MKLNKKFIPFALVTLLVLFGAVFIVSAQTNKKDTVVQGETTTVKKDVNVDVDVNKTTETTEGSTSSDQEVVASGDQTVAYNNSVSSVATPASSNTAVAPIVETPAPAPQTPVVVTPTPVPTPPVVPPVTPPTPPVTPPTPPVVPPVVATNLIANPSVETSAGNLPTGWINNVYTAEGSTNNAAFSYENAGHTGSYSLKTTITSLSGVGDAKWSFTPVTVTPGTTYKYSNWYKSDVSTQLYIMVNFADGTTQFYYLTAASASVDWAQVSAMFTMPANATSATVFQALLGVGYVQSDDFSFAAYTPTSFSRALVSLTFDDGWRSIYDNGLPLLNKYGFVSTQYLLTSTVDYPDYMTVDMMKAFKDAGSEIAAHTVHHCDLTGVQSEDPSVCPTPIPASQVQSELVDSKTGLESSLGVVVTDFATPYGAYNADVIAAIKGAGYESHRSVETGFNSADNFNPYNIKVQNITNTTTLAQVQAWVDEAIANKTWLVIVYHEVDANVADPTYAVTPENLDAQLAYIKQTGVAVVTVAQALDELAPQATTTL